MMHGTLQNIFYKVASYICPKFLYMALKLKNITKINNSLLKCIFDLLNGKDASNRHVNNTAKRQKVIGSP